MNLVSELLINFLPAGKKVTPSGWTKFNGPCCVNNGETRDTKQRAGVITDNDVFSYHCFNCGFKASWQPGRTISYKMHKLMQWLSVPDDVIDRLKLDIIKLGQDETTIHANLGLPKFSKIPLPDGFKNLTQAVEQKDTSADPIVKYLAKRNLSLSDSEFLFSNNNPVHRNRVIIPFYYQGDLVGWTARGIKDQKPKYLSEQQKGYVFNIDQQNDNKKFCIVCEGPFDALQVGGCAILGNTVQDQQNLLINQLNKPIIAVPDRDAAGQKLVNHAIDNEWMVSMPAWSDDIKDIDDAVNKYGRLYTLYSIVESAEYSNVKIRLKEKSWFKK